MSAATTLGELPKQYDHARAQDRWYAYWEDQGYFAADPDPARQSFCIVIPPPNVTGALHLGHALNNTLQDILIRFRRMQGYNTLWMPGTDHAGIATQAVVERRLREEEGLTRHDLGRERLVERIWEWKDQYEARILAQLKQMGASCDWRRTRFTLDETCARAVRQTFFRLFQDGCIYRGKKLVNWDTFLQTAVSDDEVFHDTIQGHFWHFQYPVIDPRPGEPRQVEIATTRPETMLGDTAVAVHPDPEAALAAAEAQLAQKIAAAPAKEKPELEKQLEQLCKRQRALLPKLIQLRDMARDGRMIMLPLVNREIPLICDEWAKPELGTGCVKITPAHDPNDYEVGLRRNLPMVNILNPDGTLNSHAGPYEGMTIKVARARVVADLDDLELLGQIEDREIDLAHSDRSKTAIEPFLADQWFVKMETLAQLAMDAVSDGRVKITPERYAKGYLDWLREKRDWPIGRQLWWGHQIPIWTKVVATAKELKALKEQLDAAPDIAANHAAYQVELNQYRQGETPDGTTVHGAEKFAEPHAFVHVSLASEDAAAEARYVEMGFVREEDVLDTWFSSALWPHSTLGWPEKTRELECFYPTSVLITSRDIITLWVARMVLTGLYNMGEVPFHEVYVHPKILDGDGETMSKSKGNGVDPYDVIEKFGADALRFGIAYLTTETQDVRMPVEFECPHCGALIHQTKKNRQLPKVECPKCREMFSTQWATQPEDKALPRGAAVSEQFELGRNFANKLWNAARFVLMNLEDYHAVAIQEDDLKVEDRWLLSRLATVTDEVTAAFQSYRYADAARTLYHFAWDEFCSFYVEMCKPRLAEESDRPLAQRVLAYALDTLVRLLQPVTPFLAEEIWQRLGELAPARDWRESAPAAASVVIAPWPKSREEDRDAQREAQLAEFQAVLAAVREIRSRQGIAPKETVRFSVRCSELVAALLEPMTPYFASMARAEPTGWGPEAAAPELSANQSLSGKEVFVDLTGLMDVGAEIARLERELGKLGGWIAGIEKKLANENFVSRAPAEVVNKERSRLAELSEQRQAQQVALEKLRRQG